MPWPCSLLALRTRTWLRDYERLQALAGILLYVQIGCSLVGSLSPLYNGVLLINLVVALFALAAIESGSQGLGRAYAALLFCAVLVDIVWFILFANAIWSMNPEKIESSFVFSLRLALSMQIIGFSVRFLSSFIWIQMYRLGIPSNTPHREQGSDVRNSFINPPFFWTVTETENSSSDDTLGGSIYDSGYYSQLFEDAQDKGCVQQGPNGAIDDSSPSR